MLRPQNAEHAEIASFRYSFELHDDGLVLIRSERNLAELAFVHRFHTQDISTFSALSATERNSFRPSVPPSSASEQRSGCGIMPSTLPRALMMPEILCSEPFGLAEGTTRPPGSQ